MANKQQQQTTTTSNNNHRQQTTTITQQYILPFSVPTKTLGKWGREIWYINTTATTMTTNTILYNAYKSHLLQCFMTNLLLGESKGKKTSILGTRYCVEMWKHKKNISFLHGLGDQRYFTFGIFDHLDRIQFVHTPYTLTIDTHYFHILT